MRTRPHARSRPVSFTRGILLLALLALGCGRDGPAAPASGLQLEVTGRLERGATVSLRASAATAVKWSAEPANAVEFLPGVGVRLLQTGSVTLRAEADGQSGELGIDVAPPPTIVFDMLRDGNRAIYRAALDGGDLVQLTTLDGENRDPTAAAGTVVFVSYRDGVGQLYSVPLAGGSVKRLTNSIGEKASPALSRDGRRLAFTNSVSGVPRLWIAAVDGSGAARASAGFGHGGAIEASPNWAPAGDRLVFVSTTSGNADLYLFSTGSTRVDTLLNAPTPEVEPAWSPDGAWVAFTSARGGQTDLYTISVVTREVRRLTDRAETDASPAWLPDGRLVYVAWVNNVPRLRWLDPSDPGEVHEIPIGDGTVGRVSGAW